MITLGREFISPNETFPACADDLLAEAADHSTEVDLAHYAIVEGAVPRLSNSSLAQHRWLAKEWSSLLGMGPQDPPEPVQARGTIARSGKLLDAKELAGQISDMVVAGVIGKLAAAGLTPENIKKLQNLGAVPPIDAGQTAGLGDRILTKSPAAGHAEKNIMKLSTSGGGAPPFGSGEGSQSVRSPLRLGSGPDDSEMAPLSGDQGPFTCSGFNPTSPAQFSSQRKRATLPEVIISQEERIPPRAKKRARHNEVGCEKDDVLMVNNEGQPDSFSASYSPALASKLPGLSEESIMLENIQHRDQDEDDLLRENIRGALQKLLQQSDAREKGKSQMEAILLIMRKRQDGLITMRTGGGKSMLWLVPPLLDPEARFIVVCPFTVLLNQQREFAQRRGLRAIQYGAGDITDHVQILFVQVEHVGCRKFSEWVPSIVVI